MEHTPAVRSLTPAQGKCSAPLPSNFPNPKTGGRRKKHCAVKEWKDAEPANRRSKNVPLRELKLFYWPAAVTLAILRYVALASTPKEPGSCEKPAAGYSRPAWLRSVCGLPTGLTAATETQAFGRVADCSKFDPLLRSNVSQLAL